MRRLGAGSLALLLAGCVCSGRGQVAEAPKQWLTDGAGLLSKETNRALNERLASFEAKTGHQVVVWIGASTGGRPIEDFAEEAFRAWRVGRQGLDDGVVLFIFPKDKEARIEVGYGLEAQVPDVVASRLLGEELFPGLQAGRPDEAVTKTVEALLARVEGKVAPGAPPPVASQSSPAQPRLRASPAQLAVLALAALLLFGLFLVNPRLALQLLFVIGGTGRGGRRGGGGGGGWGFSGGGGRSGGGGASGHW